MKYWGYDSITSDISLSYVNLVLDFRLFKLNKVILCQTSRILEPINDYKFVLTAQSTYISSFVITWNVYIINCVVFTGPKRKRLTFVCGVQNSKKGNILFHKNLLRRGRKSVICVGSKASSSFVGSRLFVCM